jgi:hypothetical protein
VIINGTVESVMTIAKKKKRITSLNDLPAFNLEEFLLHEDKPASWWLDILSRFIFEFSTVEGTKSYQKRLTVGEFKAQFIFRPTTSIQKGSSEIQVEALSIAGLLGDLAPFICSYPSPSYGTEPIPKGRLYPYVLKYEPCRITSRIVSPIATTEIFQMADIAKLRLDEKRDLRQPIHTEKDSFFENYYDFDDDDVVDTKQRFANSAYFSVDLTASNEALVRDFLKEIDEARLVKSVKVSVKPVTNNKLSKLREYRIIPLLTLMLWEELTDSKIKNSVLSMVLFPDGSKGERELIETIIPFAKTSITIAFSKELSSLCEADEYQEY